MGDGTRTRKRAPRFRALQRCSPEISSTIRGTRVARKEKKIYSACDIAMALLQQKKATTMTSLTELITLIIYIHTTLDLIGNASEKKTPPLSSEAYQTRNSDSLTLYNIEHISQFWKENKFIRRHMLHNNISKKIKMTKNGRKLQAHDEV